MLHEEVDSVLCQDLPPTIADIPKLEYTEKVFTESMRLYPPAWAVGRQAIHDRKIGEYTIPACSTVLMSQYLIHRDPRFFPEPERFNPNAGILTEEEICHALVTFHLVVDQDHVSVSHLLGLKVY
jgi:cytochrome P450